LGDHNIGKPVLSVICVALPANFFGKVKGALEAMNISGLVISDHLQVLLQELKLQLQNLYGECLLPYSYQILLRLQ